VKRVTILGSTGSIGTNVLDVVRRHPGRFRVAGLSARTNVRLLRRQVQEFRPAWITVETSRHGSWDPARIVDGPDPLAELVNRTNPDILVIAVVGFAGLSPLMQAIALQVPVVALANKESIVVGGDIVNRALDRSRTRIVPVDSEHSAVFQCLAGEPAAHLRRIILTASGGPLFRRPEAPRDAASIVRHPVWRMGRKISVDSATLVNKGFEYVEAHYLFRVPYSSIDILIHPQSVVHSMVEFTDGSVRALLSAPDMRIPISYALGFPDRLANAARSLRLADLNRLEFIAPDYRRFPLLRLLMDAARAGQSRVVAFNAADEVAVREFIAERIAFDDIRRVIAGVMDRHRPGPVRSVRDIQEIDAEAAREACTLARRIAERKRR